MEPVISEERFGDIPQPRSQAPAHQFDPLASWMRWADGVCGRKYGLQPGPRGLVICHSWFGRLCRLDVE